MANDRTTIYEYGPNADFSDLANPFGGDWTVQTKKTVTGDANETHEYEYNVSFRQGCMNLFGWAAIVAVFLVTDQEDSNVRAKKSVELPSELASAERRFAKWRRARKPGTRIPERLWALAVKLAATYGLHPTGS